MYGTVTPHGPASTVYFTPYTIIVLLLASCIQLLRALTSVEGLFVVSVERMYPRMVTWHGDEHVKYSASTEKLDIKLYVHLQCIRRAL